MLSQNEVLEQSKGAYAQWGEKWRNHAIENGKKYKAEGRSHLDLYKRGAGKTALLVGMGPSFEKNIELIKKYKDNVEVSCCDKAFHKLVEHGIIPKYVNICDAGISYERWLEPWIEQTKDTTLLCNITGNTDWSMNWKGPVIFFTNKDNIHSEIEFSELSGCKDMIPAGSNVSNSLVIFLTQLLGYDKYLLVGYDYSFSDDENYYAFYDDDKRYWMRHISKITRHGNFTYTSQNLFFSLRWMNDFYKGALVPNGIKLYDCSDSHLLDVPSRKLETMLMLSGTRKLTNDEKNKIAHVCVKKFSAKNEEELKTGLSMFNPVEIDIKYVPEEVSAWLELS